MRFSEAPVERCVPLRLGRLSGGTLGLELGSARSQLSVDLFLITHTVSSTLVGCLAFWLLVWTGRG
jgi:hypothetical protein